MYLCKKARLFLLLTCFGISGNGACLQLLHRLFDAHKQLYPQKPNVISS